MDVIRRSTDCRRTTAPITFDRWQLCKTVSPGFAVRMRRIVAAVTHETVKVPACTVQPDVQAKPAGGSISYEHGSAVVLKSRGERWVVLIRGSLAFGRGPGNHSGILAYYSCITVEHENPIPSVAELNTLEASEALAALEMLRQRRVLAEAGVESAWIRVAVEYYSDGAVKRAISQQVPRVPVSRDN